MGKAALGAFIVAAFVVIIILGARKPAHQPQVAPATSTKTAPVKEEAKMPAVRTLGMDEAHSNMLKDKRILLLDVRTPEEYANGHIAGAKLLPLAESDVFGPKVLEMVPDKNTAVYVVCRSGRRSGIAAEIMLKLGYVNVYNIGGVIDWKYGLESED